MLLRNSQRFGGRIRGALRLSEPPVQVAVEGSGAGQKERGLMIAGEGVRLGATAAGFFGVTEHPRAKTCVAHGNYDSVRDRSLKLRLIDRFDQAAEACEMILESDQVSAIETYHHLRKLRHYQAHVATLALGQFERLVRERRRAGIVARDVDRGVGPNYLKKELRKVAGLLGERSRMLNHLDSFGCGVSLGALQDPTQNAHQSEFTRVTLRRCGERVEHRKRLPEVLLGLLQCPTSIGGLPGPLPCRDCRLRLARAGPVACEEFRLRLSQGDEFLRNGRRDAAMQFLAPALEQRFVCGILD